MLQYGAGVDFQRIFEGKRKEYCFEVVVAVGPFFEHMQAQVDFAIWEKDQGIYRDFLRLLISSRMAIARR